MTFTVTDSTGGSDSRTIDIVTRADQRGARAAAGRQPDRRRGRRCSTSSSCAVDTDGDVLTWSATGLPPGATLDPTTGRLRWQTNYFSAGTYTGVALTVSDGAASSTETIAITVTPTDQAPDLLAAAAALHRRSSGRSSSR